MRGLLHEFGFVIPVGAHHVVPRVWALIEDADSGVPDALRDVFATVCQDRLESPDRLRAWALRLDKSVGHNKAAVALANKLARIVWAVWTHDHDFAPVAHAA